MKPLKSILNIAFLLLAFNTGDSKSEYILPPQASSVCAADLNLDGNLDIVVGHSYSQLIDWTGITMLINDGNGYLAKDTFYLNGQHTKVLVDKLNNNDEPDLVTQYYDGITSQIGILFDFFEGQSNLVNLDLTSYADYISKGDVNGDGFSDIIFASNNGKYWGVIYNEGTGNFTGPSYYSTEYWPNDLAVGDIDGNGRDDIALCGTDTEIYYSFESGFEYFLLSGIEHDIELDDMDNDGDLDVITVWGAFVTTYIIYENLGYQNFEQNIIFSFQGASGGLLTPDLNNDSLPDITFMDGVKFYFLYNLGNFEFSESDTITPANFPYSTNYCWGDLDNNSFPDIIAFKEMGTCAPNLKVLFNDGNGNFGENPITATEITKAKNQKPNITCYPNPFTSETNIEINLEEKSFAEISIYDLYGKKVKNLIYNTTKGGSNTIKWDGLDYGGESCEPGPYLLTLTVNGNIIKTAKLIKH